MTENCINCYSYIVNKVYTNHFTFAQDENKKGTTQKNPNILHLNTEFQNAFLKGAICTQLNCANCLHKLVLALILAAYQHKKTKHYNFKVNNIDNSNNTNSIWKVFFPKTKGMGISGKAMWVLTTDSVGDWALEEPPVCNKIHINLHWTVHVPSLWVSRSP